MIVAHLADLHLGHRAYGRTEAGRNLRERDVARAFRTAVNELVRLRPDLILVAGDLFDHAEPPASALVVLARSLETLRSSLPETPVLMAAGARDTPRSWGDPGALAALDTFTNVEAATGTVRSVHVRDGDAHVLLLPHRAVLHEPRPEVRSDPDARWNILLGYGRLAGDGEGDAPAEERRDRDAPPGLRVSGDEWDYVALGYEHGFRVAAPGVVYAGSLERVGPEPWAEAHRAKGFVLADLASGEVEHHEISGRPVVALAPIRWDPDRPERMNERIREVSREVPGGIEEKIVRLRLEEMGPEELRRLDPDLLASLRSRAFHLAVEVEAREVPQGPDPVERVVGHLKADDEEREALETLARRLMEEKPSMGEGAP